MIANLRLLLKLKSWYSKTLAAGGVVALLGQGVLWLRSGEGMDYLTGIANFLGVTTADITGTLITLIGVVMLILRAVTKTGLENK